MRFAVEHAPAFTILRVGLDSGESLFAQPNAMVSMTTRLEVAARMGAQNARRGWAGGLRNLLTGESLFTAVYTAAEDGQEIVLAPEPMGEILPLPLAGEGGYHLTRGAYLASTPGVRLSVEYSGMKGWLAAKGVFLMRAGGEGTIFCSSHGAIVRRDLADGERFVVDNRHVVAFSDTVDYRLVKATDSLRDSVFSGEGLVNRYTGPGVVYYQTRGRPSLGGALAWVIQAAT